MAKEPPKRKVGRPATGKAPHRIFRMDDESWELIAQAASVEGQTVSSYVRDTLLKAAKRRLKAG